MNRSLSIGLLLGVMLSACAGFSYRYYGIYLPDACYDQGALLAKEPRDDLPLNKCKPDDIVKGKCIVMLSDEFFSFKQDYERVKIELKACQSGG